MKNLKGLDHFSDYFKDEQEMFVIIGGMACAVTMDEVGFDFRATKDIDIVIVAHPSHRFTSKLKKYVTDGGYQISSGKNGKNGFYRFLNPKNNNYPQQLEVFAKNFEELELDEGQYIIPVETEDYAGKLSAILLEEEYFDLIKNNRKVIKKYSVIDPVVNIALKARAYNELNERKANGDETVDSSDIKKHKKDAIRLAVMLSGDTKCKVTGVAKKHMENFIKDISTDSDEYFHTLLQEYGDVSKDAIISILRSCYL